MKTTNRVKKTVRQGFHFFALAILCALGFSGSIFSQDALVQGGNKATIAVLNIDSKGIVQDASAMSYLVRLELEKTGVYSVMDKYDVADFVKKSGIDLANCYGKNCVVNAGELLGADKMITGSAERFGEKIVITLRLIDVKSKTVEKADATEYLNIQPEIQKMVEISVKKLVGIAPDQNMVNLLIDYDVPIQSPKTTLKLNGPRMGASYTLGDAGKRLQAGKEQGGYNMFPVTSQIGWQQEYQYLSAGNFQALVEGVVMIGGLESGQFIPSFTFLNGFRGSKNGWEFAFGPTFRFVQKANGYFDQYGNWNLKSSWKPDSTNNFQEKPGYYDNDEYHAYKIESQLDNRGSVQLSTGLLIAVGKTFKSGYLNIPVNVYVSPRKEGTIVGASFGFNVSKKPRVE